MSRMTKVDWVAVGLAVSGVLVVVVAHAIDSGEGTLSEIGGLMTWAAIAVAIYGFVTRSMDK